MNRSNTYIVDPREDHRTDPPTEWFISETDRQRKLKVAFVAKDGNVFLKTAYEPNDVEIRIYAKHSSPDPDLLY